MNAAERALWDLVRAKAPLEVCGVVYVPAARIAELEAQLAAARAALAACREVAGKRAGKGTQPCVEVPLSDGQGRTGPGDHR